MGDDFVRQPGLHVQGPRCDTWRQGHPDHRVQRSLPQSLGWGLPRSAAVGSYARDGGRTAAEHHRYGPCPGAFGASFHRGEARIGCNGTERQCAKVLRHSGLEPQGVGRLRYLRANEDLYSNDPGTPMLHQAASGGHAELMSMLRLKDNHARTALHEAASGGHERVVWCGGCCAARQTHIDTFKMTCIRRP